jgi:hypothetical protein
MLDGKLGRELDGTYTMWRHVVCSIPRNLLYGGHNWEHNIGEMS